MKEKRRRRSSEDRKPELLKMRNTFFDWCYAGSKSIIEGIYSEDFFEDGLRTDNIFCSDYFEEIPEKIFHNAQIVKIYGENLARCREEKKWTLKETAEIIGITFQALQQIEVGNRTKIDRILLFCGVYQKSPEELMGLDIPKRECPMIFYPEDVSKKTSYIVDRLIYQDIDLLDIFINFAKMPISIRKKLSAFFKATPAIHILSDKEIEAIIKNPHDLIIPHGENGELILSRNWPDYYGKLNDMGLETPELLNIFVSISSGNEEVWERVENLISFSGFMPPQK